MNISSYFVLAKLRPEHCISGTTSRPCRTYNTLPTILWEIVNSGRFRISQTGLRQRPGWGRGREGLGSNPSFDQFSLKTTWKCSWSRNRGVSPSHPINPPLQNPSYPAVIHFLLGVKCYTCSAFEIYSHNLAF